MDIISIFVSLLSAIIGGSIGVFLSTRNDKKREIESLVFEYRLKIKEAMSIIWVAESKQELFYPLDWLEVAADDPRLHVDKLIVTEFKKAVKACWFNYKDSVENSDEYHGINVDLMESMENSAKKLDDVVSGKYNS